jgi:RHS repeat-associated protein
VTNLCQYDSLNRLTNLTWKLNAGSLANFSYLLGATGNRTNLTESVNGTSRAYAWQYDTLYRLTNENFNASSNLAYAYDVVGNRTNRTSSVSSLTNQNFTFNTNDWLMTDHYDNNGNTTNSSGNAYQYDVMNHLTNLNGTVFITYDGDGNRVIKTTGGTNTFYLLDDQNPSGYAQVLEEWTVTATATNVSKIYNYGLNLISQRAPSISTNYFVYDGHGSTRLLVDIGGNVQNLFAYDAYGTLIASNASPQTLYLYGGQQFDQNLGLYYNRARYLSTGLGRFWTADTTDGNNEDPLSLHKYLYAEDDPVDGSDPSGNDDSLDSMSMAVYSSVLQLSLNTLESVGVVSAATAPYPVLVVTMGSKQYMPETTVKDDAQAAIIPGAVKGVTKIYIAVPPTANPQAMVNYWSNHSFYDNEFAFRDYFKIGGAHDYKNDKQFADRAIFDAFGNFNYGACGEAAGVPHWLLQHEANKGKPGGNNPINTADINSGFDAIEKGGTLSTKMESLVPPSSSP